MADNSTLLEIIHTKYKKQDGLLRLLSNEIAWTTSRSERPKICVAFSEIKVQRISPETSSKVQLQIVLHDGNSYSFQFTNSNGADASKQDRNQVKELLAQLIPVHRQRANKELEEKNRLLKENPELYQLYKDLVVSGVISPEEFWANRGKNFGGQQTDDAGSQSVGLPSAFLADIMPDSRTCNELKYNLTADTIEAIFKTYPAVKKKHQECVPHEMTEREFWTKFFQSHYFHRDRLNSKPQFSDMFLECAKKDEDDHLQVSLKDIPDPLLDLTDSSPLPDEGYGLSSSVVKDQQATSSSKKNTSDNLSLMRRFNHHSTMVIKASESRKSDQGNVKNHTKTAQENHRNGSSTPEEPPSKKVRVREAIVYDDLEENAKTEYQRLKITDTKTYSQGLAVATQKNQETNGRQSHQNVDNITALQYCQYQIQNWTPKLSESLSSDLAVRAMAELCPGGSLMSNTSQHNLSDTYSSSMQTDLRHHYISLTELLRHFWSCFPVTSQFLEEKAEKMYNCLEKFREKKLQTFQDSLSPENQQLLVHLNEKLDAALSKYRTWQEKKSGVKIAS